MPKRRTFPKMPALRKSRRMRLVRCRTPAKGQLRIRGIKYVPSKEEFDAAYWRVKKDHGEPIIQEHVWKKGYCTACLLLDRNSREIASFTYERIKEYPLKRRSYSCRHKLQK